MNKNIFFVVSDFEKIADELNIRYCMDKSFEGDFNDKIVFASKSDFTSGEKYIECFFSYFPNETHINVQIPHLTFKNLSESIGEKFGKLIKSKIKSNPGFQVKVATGQYQISII